MLTNFKTMRTRIERLAQLKRMQEDGTFDMLPKKEVMKLMGEMAKLEKYLGGVKDMKRLPGALFIVDSRKEHNAIAEARKLHIPHYRHRRHQLRPRRGRLRDTRQRRRHPRH